MWDSSLFGERNSTIGVLKVRRAVEDLQKCEKFKQKLDNLMKNKVVQEYISAKQDMGKIIDKFGLTGHMTVNRKDCDGCGNKNSVISVIIEAVSVKERIEYSNCEICSKG